MAKAYKCDLCNGFYDDECSHVELGFNQFELCKNCYKQLEDKALEIKNKNTNRGHSDF